MDRIKYECIYRYTYNCINIITYVISLLDYAAKYVATIHNKCLA